MPRFWEVVPSPVKRVAAVKQPIPLESWEVGEEPPTPPPFPEPTPLQPGVEYPSTETLPYWATSPGGYALLLSPDNTPQERAKIDAMEDMTPEERVRVWNDPNWTGTREIPGGIEVPGYRATQLRRKIEALVPQPEPLPPDEEPFDPRLVEQAEKGMYVPGVSEKLIVRGLPPELRAELDPLLSPPTTREERGYQLWPDLPPQPLITRLVMEGVRGAGRTAAFRQLGEVGAGAGAITASAAGVVGGTPVGQAWQRAAVPLAGYIGHHFDPDIKQRTERLRRAIAQVEEGASPVAAFDQIGTYLYNKEPMPFWTGFAYEGLNPINYLGPAEIRAGGKLGQSLAQSLSRAGGLRGVLLSSLDDLARSPRLSAAVRRAFEEEAGRIRLNELGFTLPERLDGFIKRWKKGEVTWDEASGQYKEGGKVTPLTKEADAVFGRPENLDAAADAFNVGPSPTTFHPTRDPGVVAVTSREALVEEFIAAPKTYVAERGRKLATDARPLLSVTAIPLEALPGKALYDVVSRLDNPAIFPDKPSFAAYMNEAGGFDAARAKLRKEGYDAIYIPESRVGGGEIYVLDKAKVSTPFTPEVLTEARLQAMRKVAAELGEQERNVPPPPPPLPTERDLSDLVDDAVSRLSKPNAATGEAQLRRLEREGLDVSGARGELDNYRSIERRDYDSYENFAADRADAWDAFVESVQDIDAVVDEAIPPPGATPKPSGTLTPDDIHILAKAKGIPYDNDPAFMSWTKQLTGKEHLDDMTPSELGVVREALARGETPSGAGVGAGAGAGGGGEIPPTGPPALPTGPPPSLGEEPFTGLFPPTGDPALRQPFSLFAKDFYEKWIVQHPNKEDLTGLADEINRLWKQAHPLEDVPLTGLAEEINRLTGGFVPPGAIAGLPRFHPATEKLLDLVRRTGLDTDAFAAALQRTSLPGDPVGAFRRTVDPVYQVITPSVTQGPLRTAIRQSGYYGSYQARRIVERRQVIGDMLNEAFGTVTADPIPSLTDAYRGVRGTSAEPYVGTLWHVLDASSSYELTPLQYRAVKEWQQLLDGEMRISEAVGLPTSLIEDVWVAHSFKPPAGQPLPTGLRSRTGVEGGYPRFLRERTLDTSQFLDYAKANGLAIDTDVMGILSRRLTGTSRLRTEYLFMKGVTESVGGRELANVLDKVPPNFTRFDVAGKRAFIVPNEHAQGVREALEGPRDLSGFAAGVEEKIIQYQNLLLNFDASVGFGRQGFLAFLADPYGAMSGWGEATSYALNSQHGMALMLAQHGEGMADAAQHGLALAISPTDITKSMREAEAKLWTDYIDPLRRFNDFQFNQIMPIQKYREYSVLLDSLKAMRDGVGMNKVLMDVPFIGGAARKLAGRIPNMTDDELKFAAADAVNNWLGGADYIKIGTQGGADRLLTKIAVLTPGWLRGQINTVKNAASIGTAEGVLARRLLASEIANVTMLSVAANYAINGRLPVLDPREGKWLDINVGESWYTVLPHKSLLRTMAQLLGGAAPSYAGREQGPLEQRVNAAIDFIGGRQSQPVQIAKDVVAKKDFYGNPIDMTPVGIASYVASQVAPILGQEIQTAVRDGLAPQETLGRVLAQFIGWNARGLSRQERVAGVQETIPQVTYYNNAQKIAAQFVAGGDEGKAQLLEEYQDLSYKDWKGEITVKENTRLQAMKEDYPSLTSEYDTAWRQFRKGLELTSSDLRRYLAEPGLRDPRDSLKEAPKPLPLAVPAKPPEGFGTSIEATGKLTASQANDVLAQLASQVWGRDDATTGKPLFYNQLTKGENSERSAISEWEERLDARVKERYGASFRWRDLPKAYRDMVIGLVGVVKTPPSLRRDYYNRIIGALGLQADRLEPVVEETVTPELPETPPTPTPLALPPRAPLLPASAVR